MHRALALPSRRHRRHLAVVPTRTPEPNTATVSADTFAQRHWTATLAAAGLTWDTHTTPAEVVDAIMPELERLVGWLALVREGGIEDREPDPTQGVDAAGAVAVIELLRDIQAAAHLALG